MELVLTPIEARVLGVLIEKATTTPDYYPLSLSGLTTGSNQKSNREPVMSLGETTVMEALDGLMAKRLVWEKNPLREPGYQVRPPVVQHPRAHLRLLRQRARSTLRANAQGAAHHR